jgi:hypothetical protein
MPYGLFALLLLVLQPPAIGRATISDKKSETAMQNPALFHVLLDHLESIGTPLAGIDRFVDRWHQLRSRDAFPCPVCYLAGEEQPLVALPRKRKFEPVKCPKCGTQFDVLIED